MVVICSHVLTDLAGQRWKWENAKGLIRERISKYFKRLEREILKCDFLSFKSLTFIVVYDPYCVNVFTKGVC